MRKYSQNNKQTESDFMKSAIVFRKLSETIKVYTESEINKVLYDVKQRIEKQNALEMRANWTDLKKLLLEKKNMIKRQKSLKTEEKSLRKSELRIDTKRLSNGVVRRNRAKNQEHCSISFDEDQFDNNVATKIQRKSNRPQLFSNQSKKYRINRFQQNKQNSKIMSQSEQTLKQLGKSFYSNPRSITSKHSQTLYNTKKQYLNTLLSFPSAEYFKKLNENIYDHQSRYKVKKIPELQRQGTEIQNYLNQCSQVLQKHYISIDKIQQAQDVKNHRVFRHTFENNTRLDKKSKNKLKICQLRKVIPKKRIKQILPSNHSAWFKIEKCQ